MRAGLPTGTVTFLFTDIEGSTRLLHHLGAEGYAAALAEHRWVLREAFAAGGGVEVDTQGDAFFVAFPTAPGALDAARRAVKELDGGPVRVRVGLHTGTPLLTDEGYVGVDVHRAARIAACGHGGQVLVSASTAALVEPGLLTDLGEHRLKDLTAPERIFQLGSDEFPRLKTLHQTNLPVPATPFFGRAKELEQLQPLLAPGHPRLVTLTGSGGTGKTRLALQAAADAADSYPDGVFWVPLATVRDPSLVMPTVARALDAGDDLAALLASKSLLLVLDNLEQVVAAAPDLAALLTTCPRLQMLVTSREVLAVAGEQVVPVPPFDPSEGSEFFLQRARAARPDVVITPGVTELCARLDNLPLALELAAARVRMMSVDQLAERLGNRLDLLRAGRGAEARQSTLRATIEWSHDLLDTAEQELFARLGVFDGGCTLEAAEIVCAADVDVLQSLVDKSLLRLRDDGRFRMLETVREFAAEHLAASDQAELTRDRHAQYFLARTRQPGFGMEALEASLSVFTEVQVEHPNLLAALDHLERTGSKQATLAMTAALTPFWLVGGFIALARTRLERALAADTEPTRERATALNWLAETLALTSDYPEALRYSEEALALHRSIGDVRGVAEALRGLAYCRAELGDLEAARELYDESIALLRTQPPDRLIVWTLRSLAWLHWQRGDLAGARRTYESARAEAQRQGNRSAEATLLGALGLLAVEQGRLGDAVGLTRDGMAIWSELYDPVSVGERMGGVARVLVAVERYDEAARALASSRSMLTRLGVEVPWVLRMNADTEVVLAEHRPGLDLSAVQRSVADATLEQMITWAVDVLDSVSRAGRPGDARGPGS